MRITDIEAIVVESDIDAASLPGVGDVEVSSVVVTLETDGEITGIGESFHRTVDENLILAQAIENLGMELMDENPLEVHRLWEQLYTKVKRTGEYEALSALDEAMWDIKGKNAGQPVYELLGGNASTVDAYATFPIAKSAEELIDDAHWLAEHGFDSFKIGAGLGVEKDRRRIREITDATPDEFGLAIDSNTSYSFSDALAVAETASECGLEWFEEPISHTDISGQAELRKRVSVPIAAYQTHTPHYPAVEHLRADALDIYQPSLDHGGGITAARRVATLAEAFNKELVPHAYGPGINYAASLHVAAASPACSLIEFSVLTDDIDDPTQFIASPFLENQDTLSVDSNGTISPPDEPGLGVTLDHDAIDTYRVD